MSQSVHLYSEKQQRRSASCAVTVQLSGQRVCSLYIKGRPQVLGYYAAIITNCGQIAFESPCVRYSLMCKSSISKLKDIHAEVSDLFKKYAESFQRMLTIVVS